MHVEPHAVHRDRVEQGFPRCTRIHVNGSSAKSRKDVIGEAYKNRFEMLLHGRACMHLHFVRKDQQVPLTSLRRYGRVISVRRECRCLLLDPQKGSLFSIVLVWLQESHPEEEQLLFCGFQDTADAVRFSDPLMPKVYKLTDAFHGTFPRFERVIVNKHASSFAQFHRYAGSLS